MERVLDTLLGPIARLAVAKGLLFPQVAERLKLAFVRGAGALVSQPTDSRISVMTGLQRRDIARLRDLGEAPPVVHHLARLVLQWQAGLPADISRADFDALAATIRKDVHPRTLLEQLVAAGTVAVTGDRVRLVTSSYQPLAGSEDQLDYLASNGADMLNAGVGNVLGAAHFERAAHFNQLSAEAVATLQASFAAQQMAVLQRIAAEAAALQDSAPGAHRFRAGGYFYSEDQGDG